MKALAQNLKRLRKAQGLTQAQLAERCDLPRASLASMEKNSTNPGVESVMAVAKALSIPIDELLSPTPEQRFYKVSAQDAQDYRSTDGFFISRTVSPIASKGVQVQDVTLRARCNSVGRPHPIGSIEYFYVSEGAAELIIDGESVHLEEGSLVQFPGHFRHIYKNPSDHQDTRALSVVVFAPG